MSEQPPGNRNQEANPAEETSAARRIAESVVSPIERAWNFVGDYLDARNARIQEKNQSPEREAARGNFREHLKLGTKLVPLGIFAAGMIGIGLFIKLYEKVLELDKRWASAFGLGLGK